MSNTKLTIGVVLAIVIAVLAYFHTPIQKAVFGSTSCQTNTCLQGGFVVSGDVTASSSALTAAVGCFQLHATSTATWIKETFVTTGATSTYPGTVYWSYGTCTS